MLTTPQENMITVLTSMTMLQGIHLNACLIEVTLETILHALQSLDTKEAKTLLEFDTCRDMRTYNYRLRHPDGRH
eukprot:12920926-Prorocentrum_lima.AAC.1